MSSATFDVLFLVARPAAGKSEIIDYLKRTPDEVRQSHFHVGQFVELDDFPMLWDWLEEDEILTNMGCPRLHSDADGHFISPELWHVLIERLGRAYGRLQRDRPGFHTAGGTAIVEFARGSEHGGFRAAFDHVPSEMLRRGAVLYVNVSWQESLRKNRARFNPERPDSILEHSLSDAKLARLYRDSDWAGFSAANPTHLSIQGQGVPYAVFENEDDVTTAHGTALGQRLAETLDRLWGVYGQGQVAIETTTA